MKRHPVDVIVNDGMTVKQLINALKQYRMSEKVYFQADYRRGSASAYLHDVTSVKYEDCGGHDFEYRIVIGDALDDL